MHKAGSRLSTRPPGPPGPPVPPLFRSCSPAAPPRWPCRSTRPCCRAVWRWTWASPGPGGAWHSAGREARHSPGGGGGEGGGQQGGHQVWGGRGGSRVGKGAGLEAVGLGCHHLVLILILLKLQYLALCHLCGTHVHHMWTVCNHHLDRAATSVRIGIIQITRIGQLVSSRATFTCSTHLHLMVYRLTCFPFLCSAYQ